jgi:hypothetical protein
MRPPTFELDRTCAGLRQPPLEELDFLLGRRLAVAAGHVDRDALSPAATQQLADVSARDPAEQVEDAQLHPAHRAPQRRARHLVVALEDVDAVDQRFEIACVLADEVRRHQVRQDRLQLSCLAVGRGHPDGAVARARAHDRQLAAA